MTGTPAELNWFYITGDSYAKLNTYIFFRRENTFKLYCTYFIVYPSDFILHAMFALFMPFPNLNHSK